MFGEHRTINDKLKIIFTQSKMNYIPSQFALDGNFYF